MLKKIVVLVALSLTFVGSTTASEIIGYWDEGWEQVTPPWGANMSIAFLGYSNISEALRDSSKLRSRMVGRKYLAIGGGNDAGAFSASIVEAVTAALEAGQVTGYDGIAFDVEVCKDEGLAGRFSEAFAAAKSKGLGCTRHRQPLRTIRMR